MVDRPIKVLHGPGNVGNQPWTLSRAERRLGLDSDLVVNFGNWLQYPADRVLGTYARKTPSNYVARACFAASAPRDYDVLHYYFGRTFALWDDIGVPLRRGGRFAIRDLLQAKALGKTTLMTLQGCDIRQAGPTSRAYAVSACESGRCPAFATCISSIDAMRRLMHDEVLPHIDRVFYLNPDLGRFVSRGQFLPYANVDIAASPVILPDPARRIRIVHAPSNAGIKGTPDILAALETLKSRFDFELIMVENLPHAEAMALYRQADLAIDQLLVGWYGGFAVEMMAMGKPVAAFIREDDRPFGIAKMWDELPILRIHRDTLADDLARILANPKALQDAGTRSRRFVERWHDPIRIAGALKRIYEDRSAPLDFGV
jgi:glycosyltransferase involved in cell wall biosynthesis